MGIYKNLAFKAWGLEFVQLVLEKMMRAGSP